MKKLKDQVSQLESCQKDLKQVTNSFTDLENDNQKLQGEFDALST